MGDSQLPVPYAVGYGKPPADHRFTKGRSGNPGGRLKRARAKSKSVDTGFGKKAAEQFLQLEAYRPVLLREGDEVIELPAIQAVFRAMGVAAMKGNRFVQKTLAEMVAKMEAEHHASRMELFGTMVEYKQGWDQVIESARKTGQPEPTPIPRPDDIILNPNTGDVQVLGPSTKEQKAHLDKALERRAQAQEEVNYFAEKYRRTRDAKMKARHLDDWLFEQRMFDLLNELVPGRYKAKLENRSYAPGASREGQTLAELKRDRKLRQQYVE